MEHSHKQFTIMTGIWKVFAILLEYCCQIDFQMMITKLDLEKNEELDKLRAEFKMKIFQLEDHERQVVDSQNQIKLQLEQVQKELEKETFRRQEIEDELNSHGSGHEEEIKLRLQFEGKLNQMFARQRDLNHKLKKITEISESQQAQLNDRSALVNSQKELILDLTSKNLQLENDCVYANSKIKEQQLVIETMDKKLESTLTTLEEFKQELSTLKVTHQEKLTEIIRWKIEFEALKADRDVNRFEKYKNTEIIRSLTSEREGLMMKIEELNTLYVEAYQKQRQYRKEYHKILELEKAESEQVKVLKTSLTNTKTQLDDVTGERDKLKAEWESVSVTCEDYKNQLKYALAKLDEAAEARRLIEDWNSEFEKKIASQKKDMFDKNDKISKLNKQLDMAKMENSTISEKLSALEVKYESDSNLFKYRHDENIAKIRALNAVIVAEKAKREEWIQKYEDELDKNQTLSTELNDLKQKLIYYEGDKGNIPDKIGSLVYTTKSQSQTINKQLEEIDMLNAKIEDSARKVKSLHTILEENEKDLLERKRVYDLKEAELVQDMERKSDMAYMLAEDIRSLAAYYYSLIQQKNGSIEELETSNNNNIDTVNRLKVELDILKRQYENSQMSSEDSYCSISRLDDTIEALKQEIADNKSEFKEYKKNFSKITLQIPKQFRICQEPITAMANRMKELEDRIISLQSRVPIDAKYTQTYQSLAEQISQTDIDSSFFDKISRGGISSKRISERDYTEEVYDSVNDMYDYISKTTVNIKEEPKKLKEFETEFPLRNLRNTMKVSNEDPLERERYSKNVKRIPDIEVAMGKTPLKTQTYEFGETTKPAVRLIQKVSGDSPSFRKLNNHALSLPPDSRVSSYAKMKSPKSNSSLDKSCQGTRRKQDETTAVPTERTMPVSNRQKYPHEYSSDLSSEFLHSMSHPKRANHEDSADFGTEASLNRALRRRHFNDDSSDISNPSLHMKFSGDPLSQREEDSTPVNMSSMYLHDVSDSASGNLIDSSQHLPSITKKRPSSPPDIRKYIKQATSRRKNDYNFL